MEFKTIKERFISNKTRPLVYECYSVDDFFNAIGNKVIDAENTLKAFKKYFENNNLIYSKINFNENEIFIGYRASYDSTKVKNNLVNFKINWYYHSVGPKTFYPIFFIREIDDKFYFLNFANLEISELNENIVKTNNSAFFIDNIVEEIFHNKNVIKMGLGKLCLFTAHSNKIITVDIMEKINNAIESIEEFRGGSFDSALDRVFTIKQVDSFCFTIKLRDKAMGGYLKEQWSTIEGEYDLQNMKWNKLTGTYSNESLK